MSELFGRKFGKDKDLEDSRQRRRVRSSFRADDVFVLSTLPLLSALPRDS